MFLNGLRNSASYCLKVTVQFEIGAEFLKPFKNIRPQPNNWTFL